MAHLSLKRIVKSFGAVNIIKGVDLEIADKEFVVFVGPSGCGKSTLLRLIAGLEEITSGDLMIDGEKVNDVPPDERGLAMVFQTYALYPHMTVRDNMAFALRLAGVAKEERYAKVDEVAKLLQLSPLLDRTPEAALRRPAPARRHRPRHGARAEGLPVRRAALQPRRGAARPDAHRARAAPRAARRHHDLRDA